MKTNKNVRTVQRGILSFEFSLDEIVNYLNENILMSKEIFEANILEKLHEEDADFIQNEDTCFDVKVGSLYNTLVFQYSLEQNS